MAFYKNSPRCRDCFDLSSAAVDKRVDKVLTKEVLPESTCPKIPTLTLMTSSGLGGDVFLAGDVVAASALFEGLSPGC